MKSGEKVRNRKAIHQLSTAGAREYLGTYTRKFWIVDGPPDSNNRQLAAARNIEVIQLPSARAGDLSEEDKGRLRAAVLGALG